MLISSQYTPHDVLITALKYEQFHNSALISVHITSKGDFI